MLASTAPERVSEPTCSSDVEIHFDEKRGYLELAREPAVSPRDQFNIIGDWLPSLTFAS